MVQALFVEFAIDPVLSLVGLLTGLVVGLTGMGGGALLTPALVLVFNVPPLTAVSSDIVASAFMKPVGGGVHYKSGTVHLPLVGWLVLGSVPSAFGGVWLLTHVAQGEQLNQFLRLALGSALLLVAVTLSVRQFAGKHRRARSEDGPVPAKPLTTLAIGLLGGLIVGITSVGSGSIMMLLLLLVYPRLRLRELVGTDLVQAVPLILSAAVAHLWLGSFDLGLTASIVLGALPGIYVGAKLSAKAPDHIIRPILVSTLLASSLKLLGAGPRLMLLAGVLLVLGASVWVLVGARRARTAVSPLA